MTLSIDLGEFLFSRSHKYSEVPAPVSDACVH